MTFYYPLKFAFQIKFWVSVWHCWLHLSPSLGGELSKTGNYNYILTIIHLRCRGCISSLYMFSTENRSQFEVHVLKVLSCFQWEDVVSVQAGNNNRKIQWCKTGTCGHTPTQRTGNALQMKILLCGLFYRRVCVLSGMCAVGWPYVSWVTSQRFHTWLLTRPAFFLSLFFFYFSQ